MMATQIVRAGKSVERDRYETEAEYMAAVREAEHIAEAKYLSADAERGIS